MTHRETILIEVEQVAPDGQIHAKEIQIDGPRLDSFKRFDPPSFRA